MARDKQLSAVPLRATGAVARLPTGAKLLLILSAALLPLALIAFFAAFQTTRNADANNRAELRVAATENARRLAIELSGDMTALGDTLTALTKDPGNSASCARANGVLAPGVARGARFAIIGAGGERLCGSLVDPWRGATPAGGLVARIDPGRGLLLHLAGSQPGSGATALFPTAFLEELSRPRGFDRDHGAALDSGGDTLTITELTIAQFARRDGFVVPMGIADLRYRMTAPSAPITSPVLVAMLLPVLMWLAAAGIAWFVVDRLLVRPLRQLRGQVSAYAPGTLLDPTGLSEMSAQEIRELGDAFRGLSRTIRAHEADVAEGLQRQTKLTREVHHRVKNNLQVIASLINFHARSSTGPDVAAAYASIQRRVDALAVVHRNHYAELEVNRGLGLRAVIGELAANIRATAPEASSQLGIALDIEPYLVTQDNAVAVAFLITELIELAMNIQSSAQLRISVRHADEPDRVILRVSSPTLIETAQLRTLIAERYGRVIEGLSRQLRSKLHHDPLSGAFEIAIAVTGRDDI